MESLSEVGTLNTIAQVTITLLGFTGIVVIFGSRAVSEWSATERLRFYALVARTLTAFFSRLRTGVGKPDLDSDNVYLDDL